MTIKSYNPENVQVVLSYVSRTVLADETTVSLSNWNSIAITYNEDRYEFTTSTTGVITRSKIINKLGNIEIVTPEGSDVCKWLTKLVNTNAKITFKVTEKTYPQVGGLPVVASEFIISEASISNTGSGNRARTSGERTWVLTGEVSKFVEDDYTD